MTELQYVGKLEAQSVDGLAKVTGAARYVGDMTLPGMLYCKVLRSQVPHARIKKLDVSPALAVPGVLAAITSEDFVDHGAWGWPIRDAFMLAYNKVRYVGEGIAAVAAESEAAAIAGINAILLELEPLPVVSDIHHAMDPDTPLIPEEAPQGVHNLTNTHVVRFNDAEKAMAESAETYEGTFYFAHQEHGYTETEGGLAVPEIDGSVTIFCNDQSPFINRDNAAMVLGLSKDQVRVIQPPVGGTFGGKDDIGYQIAGITGRLALKTGRPVRYTLTRSESLVASYKREAMEIKLRLGLRADGTLKAVQAELLTDSGAYSSMTPLSSWRATMHAGGCYRYEAAAVDTTVVYTNNGYSGAFRGFGNPQASGAMEIAMDELAERFGEDPIDFRLKSILRNGDTAFTGNQLLHDVNVDKCLEWVRQRSDWDKKRAVYAAEDKSQRITHGIGVACYFHGSGLGGEGLDFANGNMRIEEDYSVVMNHGLTDYGQGSRTVFTLIAAETLGVRPERIVMLRPDTQTSIDSGPTVASRATMVGGNATKVTATKLANMLNLAAADLLHCEVSQLYRHGESYVGPDEDELTFEQVVDHAREMGFQLSTTGYWQLPKIHWDFEKGTGVPYYTYSYGAQVVELSVDKYDGSVNLIKIWAAHDAGKIVYPNGAKGQMLGGIAQGIGYALTEGFTFKDGYPEKLDLKSYSMPTSLQVPEVDLTYLDTLLPEGPYGAKNLAEPTMVATAPAIVNAIYQATGVRVRDLPVDKALLTRN